MTTLMLIAYFGFLYMALKFIKNNNELKIVKQQKYLYEMEVRELKSLANFYEKEAKRLQKETIEKSTRCSKNSDKEILEAVRKAMIYSHPDKGLTDNHEDFIKYKKLYDELK